MCLKLFETSRQTVGQFRILRNRIEIAIWWHRQPYSLIFFDKPEVRTCSDWRTLPFRLHQCYAIYTPAIEENTEVAISQIMMLIQYLQSSSVVPCQFRHVFSPSSGSLGLSDAANQPFFYTMEVEPSWRKVFFFDDTNGWFSVSLISTASGHASVFSRFHPAMTSCRTSISQPC